MKKINLLSTLSITQQKEIAQWYTYTVLGCLLMFIGLLGFHLIETVQIHNLKIENAALQKKLLPYITAFDQYKTLKQSNEELKQHLMQLLKLTKPTQVMIQSVCTLLQTMTINPRSLVYTDNLFELSAYCIDNDKIKKILQELNSISSISQIRLSSLQHTERGMLMVIKGTVNSLDNFS